MVSVDRLKSWQAELGNWLQFECEEKKVTRAFCALCTKHESRLRALRNFNRAVINGVDGSRLKKDGFSKHMKSDMHIRAIDLESKPKTLEGIYKTTPLGRATAGAEAEERARVKKLIDIAYTLAKEELPFSKFAKIAELELRHGVKLGQSYLNEMKCKEFTEVIGSLMEEDLIDLARSADYISVLTDGSTDVSNTEKEMVYVMFVNHKTGQTEMHFFGLKNIKHANALGLKQLVLDAFMMCGIDILNKLVGICVDGASVNLGKISGMGVRLKEHCPWLVTIHCLNHRLELAAKDAFKGTYMDTIVEMLTSIYLLYEHSSKRLRELCEVAEIMHEHVHKPQKANGTRWLQHKSRACQSLLKSYGAVLTHLQHQASPDSDLTASDRARIQGYVNKLGSFKFALYLTFMKEMLMPLSEFSVCLQKDSCDLLYAMALLETFYNTAEKMLTMADGQPTPGGGSELQQLLTEAQQDMANVQLKGIHLKGATEAVLQSFMTKLPPLVESIADCVRKRFGDLHKDPKFSTLLLLNTTVYPSDAEELSSFGHKELQTFLNHFGELLAKHNVVTAEVAVEWDKFKAFYSRSLRHLSRRAVWELLIREYSDKFPNLVHVISILLAFPVSNAVLERGFSCMGRVKTDARNRLNQKTLENLMRISIEGPELTEFNPNRATEKFFSTRRHPNVMPYTRTGSAASPAKRPCFSDVSD